jgi:hypothetical protein
MDDDALNVGDTSLVTFTFSEAPTGFDATDVTVDNGAIGAVSSTADPLVFNATFTPTDDIEVSTNTITTGTAWTDAAGNSVASGSTSPNYAIDTKEPTLVITMDDAALNVGDTSLVTFTFSEAPTGFDDTNIFFQNGALGAVSSTADPLVFNATFTPTDNIEDLTNVLSDDQLWTDAAGNTPVAQSSSANYEVDTVEPTVVLTAIQTSPTNVSPINMTATFSEDVTEFVIGDITVGNGTTDNFVPVSATVYTFDVTPSGQGAVTIDIADSVAIDAFSNNNEAATQFSITYDTEAPTLVADGIIGSTIQGASDTITVVFDGLVQPVDGTWSADEFSALESPNNTAKTLVGATFSPTSGATDTVVITLAESATDSTTYLVNDNIITITPANNKIKDAAGNYVANSEVVGTTINGGDSSVPVLSSVVYSQVGGGTITYIKPYSQVLVTATFNEDMTNTPPTITVAAPGTVADVSAQNMSRTSGTVWTYVWTVINDATVEGTANISFAGTDLAGNTYVDAGNSIVIDSNSPSVSAFTAESITATGATLTVTTNENATCRYANTEKDYASMTVMEATGTTAHTHALTGLTASTPYNYYVRCVDASGNTMTGSSHVYFTTSAAAQGDGTLVVTSITPIRTFATAGGGFDAGWAWTFNVTVPTSEASTSMKFANWVSGSNTIAAATNIRFYSAQSSNANSTSTAITISAANTYSSAMALNTDLDATTAGRQIQIIVEARVPSGQAGGSYSTSYGVQSE